MKRKSFFMILLFLLTISASISMAINEFPSVTGIFRNYQIFYNDSPLNLKMNPIIIEDRIYVPLRFVSEELGFNVEWNEKNKSATISTPTLQEKLPVTDPFAGEYFVYGEITKVDFQNSLIEIEQHLDNHSKDIFDALKITEDTVIVLQRNSHYMEINFQDIRVGDVVGLIITKDNIVRGIIVDN